MTNEEMYAMLQNGVTYQKIADIEGISKQAVHQRMIFYKRKVNGIRGNGFNINHIVYQGIYDWFKEQLNESISSLCKKVYGYAQASTMINFRKFLKGEQDTHFTLKQMKRLCETVGKPFEEVFKRRDVI